MQAQLLYLKEIPQKDHLKFLKLCEKKLRKATFNPSFKKNKSLIGPQSSNIFILQTVDSVQ
jgi:hypothetical protein